MQLRASEVFLGTWHERTYLIARVYHKYVGSRPGEFCGGIPYPTHRG